MPLTVVEALAIAEVGAHAAGGHVELVQHRVAQAVVVQAVPDALRSVLARRGAGVEGVVLLRGHATRKQRHSHFWLHAGRCASLLLVVPNIGQN